MVKPFFLLVILKKHHLRKKSLTSQPREDNFSLMTSKGGKTLTKLLRHPREPEPIAASEFETLVEERYQSRDEFRKAF